MKQHQFTWQKLGRIFHPNGQFPWMQSHAQNPCTLLCEDKIRIYFTCRPKPDNGGNFISVTTFVDVSRKDPTSVIYVHDKPVLESGELGSFDQFGIMPGAVLPVGDEVWLYYVGWSRCIGVPYNHAIGLAISKDGGKTFSRYGKGPIITRTSSEPFLQNSPYVTIIDKPFHMWYSSGLKWIVHENRPESIYVIMHATSTDGISWQRQATPCISYNSDEECQTNPCVVFVNDLYHMWFCHRHGLDFRNSERGYRIGYASSNDLLNWERNDAIGNFDVSSEGWDSEMVCYPNVNLIDGKLCMFYSGNGFGREGFGLAILQES